MTQDRDIEVGDEVPEADALDQARPVAPLSSPEQPVIDVEVPEADALDQARSVAPPTTSEPSRVDIEVPEADALEQAQVVTWDDEDAGPD